MGKIPEFAVIFWNVSGCGKMPQLFWYGGHAASLW